MKGVWQLGMSAVGLAGVLALGACGGSSSGPKSNTTITQSEAAAIGSAASDQVAGLTASLTSFSVPDPTGGVFTSSVPTRFRTASRLIMSMATLVPASRRAALIKLLGSTGACDPTITGDTTDADGNGIPANVTFTFTSGNCTIVSVDTAGPGGPVTKTSIGMTGSWHLQDLGSPTVLWGYNFGLGNWTLNEADSSASGENSFSLGINGSTGASVQTSTGSTGSNFVYAYTVNNSKLYQLGVNWNVGFTPAGSATIDTSAATLPSGEFTISGSYGWSSTDVSTGANGTWAFSLSATSPLSYDGSCTSDPPFDGGVIQGAITGGTNAGFTITYSGCGVSPQVSAFTS
ncbi:MAG TPA: hypothetical protein VMG41_02605 [Gemmatimonadales bacterium]|nr:hypothetical protein [Gemmatimonadales bacterium]